MNFLLAFNKTNDFLKECELMDIGSQIEFELKLKPNIEKLKPKEAASDLTRMLNKKFCHPGSEKQFTVTINSKEMKAIVSCRELPTKS